MLAKEAEESEETAGAAAIPGASDQPVTVATSTGAIVALPDGLENTPGDANLATINFDDGERYSTESQACSSIQHPQLTIICPFSTEDESNLHAHAARNARLAVEAAKQRAQAFDAAAAQKLAASAPEPAPEPVGEEGDQMVTGIDSTLRLSS